EARTPTARFLVSLTGAAQPGAGADGAPVPPASARRPAAQRQGVRQRAACQDGLRAAPPVLTRHHSGAFSVSCGPRSRSVPLAAHVAVRLAAVEAPRPPCGLGHVRADNGRRCTIAVPRGWRARATPA